MAPKDPFVAPRGTVIRGAAGPFITTIPSSDAAFREYVARVASGLSTRIPGELEKGLRRIFPRVVVRERTLSGEPPRWYVYRDGAWQPGREGPWWEAPGVPRVGVTPDGWLSDANPGAASLLGIDAADLGVRHFTDFVAPGTLDDALGLFEVVTAGHDLEATILLRPTTGHVIAVDVHVALEGTDLVGHLRLAGDIDADIHVPTVAVPAVLCYPERDAAFRRYVQQVVSRLPEPTPEGLTLRLRRLYPHSHVVDSGPAWLAYRGGDPADLPPEGWWLDPALPRVRYDAQALILEVNDPAIRLLGRDMVGHYWQEFVTPASKEQVAAMLAILAEVGAAESRFRMPGRDGSLVEFDSYTEVNEETYTTVIRPR